MDREIMRIIDMRKGNMDIEYNGKVVRCWGDMTVNGFRSNVGFNVIASTMEWISPEASVKVCDDERAEIIKEVKRFGKRTKMKINFFDERYKKL